MASNASYRFSRLAWGHVDGNRPHGVTAAGLENGEPALWGPEKKFSGCWVRCQDLDDVTTILTWLSVVLLNH